MPAADLIEAYLAHLREESASSNTIRDRRRTLTVIDRDLPCGLDLATEEELRGWLWRDGLSTGSRETYYGAIVGFFRWALAADVLDFDPSAAISRPKTPARLPRPLTDEQLARILAEAAEPYRTWMVLAAYAGMRCVEISRAHREHFSERTVTVVSGKGGKSRVVGTHPLVWSVIGPLPPGPITDQDEDQISVRSCSYFSRVMGMPRVSLHRGRHWAGTMIQRLYKDLLVTQQFLGHANPATTAGYALVAAEDVTAAVALLPDLCAGDGAARPSQP